MTRYQDHDNSNSEMSTFAVARQKQKAYIAQLRKGDKGERRLAKLLAQCRKGDRCNLEECLICARRKELPRWRVPSSAVKSVIGTKTPQTIYLDGIEVVGKRRPLNEKKVREIAASMYKLGQQMPITVRMHKKEAILVSGLHRLAAAKQLGWDAILCVELCGDKNDARLWQLMENLCRADLTALERAEHTEELRTLVQFKAEGVQVAPPGGRQPKDVGIKKSAKALGLTREEIRRSKAIAGISRQGKDAAIAGKLDNSQRALLEIAKQPTANAQVKTIEEIIGRRQAERARHASAAEQKAASEIAALKAGLAKNKSTLEKLATKMADQRGRLCELKDATATGCADTAPSVTGPLATPSEDEEISVTGAPLDVDRLVEQHTAEVTILQKKIGQLEEELATARQAVSSQLAKTANPPTDVDDLAIPPFLMCRALSEVEQRQAEELEHVWANSCALVRQRFLAKYARSSATTTDAPTSANTH